VDLVPARPGRRLRLPQAGARTDPGRRPRSSACHPSAAR
jgi:hypothetical protein